MKLSVTQRILYALAALFALYLVVMAIRLAIPTDFPRDLPSAEKKDLAKLNRTQQQDFYVRFLTKVRKEHGALLTTRKQGTNVLLGKEAEAGFLVAELGFRSLNETKYLDLVSRFAKGEQVAFRVRHEQIESGDLIYQVDFYQADQRWVRILARGESLIPSSEDQQATEAGFGEAEAQERTASRGFGDGPKLVIIIDDLGNNYENFTRLIELDFDLTFSVLPGLANSEKVAQAIWDRGRQAMLHQPMQPVGWPEINPGEGALMVADDSQTIRQKLLANLDEVPHARAINNHMGSAFIRDPKGLEVLMATLAERGMAFVDSKTAPGDLAMQSAARHQVPFVSRDLFLDNEETLNAVLEQLGKAAILAQKNGLAIAIGHPKDVTWQALQQGLPLLVQEGIQIIRLSEALGLVEPN